MDLHGERNCVQLPRAEAIARLNDLLRQSADCGVVIATTGVKDLPGFDARALMRALATYDAFDAENDPHGERDMGDLTLFDADLLWKIDYYDQTLQHGSDDPSDPMQTTRVLTVMLCSEY